MTGSTERTCEADGMWSLSEPVCEGECCIIEKSYTVYIYVLNLYIAVDCGSLTDPENGQVNTSSGTTIGSTASYSCNNGYTLNGDNTRTCESNGVWSNSQPSCNSKAINYSNLGRI